MKTEAVTVKTVTVETFTVRVRFAETDKMGVAHHSNYVVWLEAARVEWLRQRGMSYRDWEETGVSLVVNSLNINYRSPVYFDDELNINVKLTEARKRRFLFSYFIKKAAEELLIASATTLHTPTNSKGKAISLPDNWFNQIINFVE